MTPEQLQTEVGKFINDSRAKSAGGLTEAERRAIVEREADDQADKLRRIAMDRKKLGACGCSCP